MELYNKTLTIIGLGYVGLPLAVEFGVENAPRLVLSSQG